MAHQMFHLAYFMKFGPPAWQAPQNRTHGADWANGKVFVDLARRLEGAGFSFILFEDTLTVSSTYGGTMDLDLSHAIYSPKHYPVPLLPLMAHGTEHIGLISTATTTFTHPWMLAREFATVDWLTGGRVGWNIVTSSETSTAQNFGMDAMPSHSDRYERADEFVEVALKLWDAWEEGSVVADVETSVYTDPSKVHTIDFEGKYFRSRGPLNTMRPPQGHPVFAQAGASSRGREFAAKYAEVIVATTGGGVEGMKALRDDIRGRMKTYGRNPDDCKVFFIAPLVITYDGKGYADGVTESLFRHELGKASTVMDIDLSKYDLDGPFPEGLVAGGHTSVLKDLQALGDQGATLREAMMAQFFSDGELNLIGTPEQIAEKMVAAMDEVGGDGFLIEGADRTEPSYLAELADRLVPALQSYGAVRTEYTGTTLRDTLRQFDDR